MIVRLNVPVVADADVVRVSVDAAVPPAAGVTLAGENVVVTPAGAPETLKLVRPLKPFKLVTMAEALMLAPAVTDTEPGVTPMLKSADGMTTTVRVRLTL